MADVIELDEVDAVIAGARGEPGQREFLIQARHGAANLTVLVEKEQVAILAREAKRLLQRLEADFPTETPNESGTGPMAISEPADPLFRARSIGLGFDPARGRLVIELREQPGDDEDEPESDDDADGWIARIYATRAQVSAMANAGSAAVVAGRPTCDLCGFPMDPSGHICPRLN
ncbi:MAG: DUF3090 family protein [Acidimicrobiia bacterium]